MNLTFTCVRCGRTFECGRSEEEALGDMRTIWGDVPPGDRAVVCEACWEAIRPARNPEWYARYLKAKGC